MSDNVTLQDLVDDAELLHVATLELSAARTDLSQSNEDVLNSFVDNGYDVEIDFNLGIDRDDEDSRFRMRLEVWIESDPGTIRVQIAAEYALDTLTVKEIEHPVMMEFANKVAVMTLLPYVRQSVADISQRVFTYPLTVPMYKAGQLTF